MTANACCGHAKCREDAYEYEAAGSLAHMLSMGGGSSAMQAACEALKNLCDGHDGCKTQATAAGGVHALVFLITKASERPQVVSTDHVSEEGGGLEAGNTPVPGLQISPGNSPPKADGRSARLAAAEREEGEIRGGSAVGMGGEPLVVDLNMLESALAALCNVLNNSQEAKTALSQEAASMGVLVSCLLSPSQVSASHKWRNLASINRCIIHHPES